jgi:hypothetical protein
MHAYQDEDTNTSACAGLVIVPPHADFASVDETAREGDAKTSASAGLVTVLPHADAASVDPTTRAEISSIRSLQLYPGMHTHGASSEETSPSSRSFHSPTSCKVHNNGNKTGMQNLQTGSSPCVHPNRTEMHRESYFDSDADSNFADFIDVSTTSSGSRCARNSSYMSSRDTWSACSSPLAVNKSKGSSYAECTPPHVSVPAPNMPPCMCQSCKHGKPCTCSCGSIMGKSTPQKSSRSAHSASYSHPSMLLTSMHHKSSHHHGTRSASFSSSSSPALHRRSTKEKHRSSTTSSPQTPNFGVRGVPSSLPSLTLTSPPQKPNRGVHSASFAHPSFRISSTLNFKNRSAHGCVAFSKRTDRSALKSLHAQANAAVDACAGGVNANCPAAQIEAEYYDEDESIRELFLSMFKEDEGGYASHGCMAGGMHNDGMCVCVYVCV